MEKRCPRCMEVLPVESFYRCSKEKDGRMFVCKACISKAYFARRALRPTKTPGDRFWSRVDKSGGADACWPWMKLLNHSGYGVAYDMTCRKQRIASRVAWELTIGPLLENECVLHVCDNPRCCNPSHLFVGTRGDNVRDMIDKGRQAVGNAMSHAKMNPDKVRDLRRRLGDGESVCSVSRAYGITPAAVRKIRDRRMWKHVA